MVLSVALRQQATSARGSAATGDTGSVSMSWIYALLFIVTTVSAGVVMARRRSWYATVAAVLIAALSIAALSQVDEVTPGAAQRVWLATNGIGLLVLVALAGSIVRRNETAPPTVRR